MAAVSLVMGGVKTADALPVTLVQQSSGEFSPAPNLSLSQLDAIGAAIDSARPKRVNGTVVEVEWVNPSVRIHVRDDQTGATVVVNTETPNSLIRAGGGREILRSGSLIAIEGYESTDGERIFVSAAGMRVDGKPLSPSDPGARPTLRQVDICGRMPDYRTTMAGSGVAQRAEAAFAWTHECDAKMRAAELRGVVVDRSPLTNSVVRQGRTP